MSYFCKDFFGNLKGNNMDLKEAVVREHLRFMREIEYSRVEELDAILERVANGLSTAEDAEILKAELNL